jgi:hypothetical protein|tara:strand:- start:511 stop:711 length:201 start_codon:yes stop_codon:yes gene_type:complete
MKIKVKGKIISIGNDIKKIKRIINIMEKIHIQTNAKRKWTDFIISMLKNKLKKVGRISYETAIKSH